METGKEKEEIRQGSEEVEMHSEKVRRLLGEIPPSLARWGMAVIVIVTLALVAAVCLLPYPYGGGESILRHLLK